jgi:hypothetical protein
MLNERIQRGQGKGERKRRNRTIGHPEKKDKTDKA